MRRLLAASFALAAFTCTSVPAFAQVTTVYDFSVATDGAANPEGGLVLGRDGRLYGTTDHGGAGGLGTVFVLDANGARTTLHEFTGYDGSEPTGRLVQAPDGALYGTAYGGGTGNRGTIFRIDEAGTFALVHAFAAGEGVHPEAGLILAADGFLYGTTVLGGAYGYGTLFRVDTSGNLSTLHAFAGGSDGSYPHAAVMQASDGTIYGATTNGGANNAGTVFKLAAGDAYSVVHNFTSAEGRWSRSSLLEGADGSLYGTTSFGGPYDNGTLFRVSPAGALTVLYAFKGADGGNPRGKLLKTVDGRLFGTTANGGATGYGTIFSLTPSGALTIVHAFSKDDGAFPIAALTQGADGHLYGTTVNGGANGQNGVVFQLTATTPVPFFVTGATGVFGDRTNLWATLSVGGVPVSGKSISFTLNGTSVGSAVTNSAGLATLAGVSLAGVDAGLHTDAVSASFDGDATTPAAHGTASLTVTRREPYVQWSWQPPVLAGTTLDGTQLNATAEMAGTFTYNPPAGTVVSQSLMLSATFTPSDQNYARVTATVSLTVIPLSSLSVLEATSPFGGTTTLSACVGSKGWAASGKQVVFTLNGAAVGSAVTDENCWARLIGVNLSGIGAGTYPNGIAANFVGDDDVPATSGTARLVVTPAVPTVVWPGPSSIVEGTPLSVTQLNASSSVAGTFAYNPPSGTLLTAGTRTLSVTFTPADSGNYATATATVSLPVTAATPSVVTYPANGATGADLTQPIQWASVANVQAYYLYIGSTLGAKNLVDTGETLQTSRTVTLPSGQLVYARLWTKVAGFWRYTDSTFTAAAVTSTLTTPATGASGVAPSLTMQWTSVPNVQASYLYVGSSPGAKNIVDTGETLQTSRTVTLPSGQTLYARMWAKVGGVWRYSDSTFTTAVVLSTLTSPVNGAQIDPSHNFTWTTVPSVQAYYLYVGTSVGTNNVVNTGETPLTSYHATSLPAGATLYARMWAKVGGVWRYSDSTFTTP